MLKLAQRNVRRQLGRTAVTLAAISMGVAALILGGGFVRDMYTQLAEALIHSQSGHLQVARDGHFTTGSRYPEKYRIEEINDLSLEIMKLPAVSQTLARMQFSALLNNGRTDWPVVGEGIEPHKESRLGSYLKITSGRSLDDEDGFGMMIGQGVANVLGIGPGDTVTLLTNTSEGALNTIDFEIIGVFETFSREFDERAVRIPLAAAQELMAAPGANVLVVELRRTSDTPAVAQRLRAELRVDSLEVRTWVELNDFFDKTVRLYERQFGVLQLITLVMVLLGVANSVNMSAFERVGEFGTMRSLGSRSRHVFRLIVTESALIGVVGALTGALLGIALASLISAIGIPMPPPPNANAGYRAHIELTPGLVAWSTMVGFVAAILASFIPAIRVTRIPVVDALRANI